MTKNTGGRQGFKEWVDRQPDPGWGLLPLTHICKGINAEDIIRANVVEPADCNVFGEPLAYFFYGRPAYRVGNEGVTKAEAACPFCFIFDSALMKKAKYIFAFDTGAFANRMYSHVLMEEMNAKDFSLEGDETRPNRIIGAVFRSRRTYLEGDISKVAPLDQAAEPWEFHARAYLDLLASRGRNEPDDRICSIEIAFGDRVPLAGYLKAVIVPHTLWNEGKKTPWLEKLHSNGIEIAGYDFVPGRHPEHYHALLEAAVRELYVRWGVI